MAYIMEQAGGVATTGVKPILDVQPEKLHQRCPVVLGSKDDVQDVLDIINRNQKWKTAKESLKFTGPLPMTMICPTLVSSFSSFVCCFFKYILKEKIRCYPVICKR